MTPVGKRLLLGGGALLAVALLVAGWNWLMGKVPRTIDLPPKGEASYNPLYALKLALQAEGLRVRSRQRLDFATVPLGARDTLVIYGDPRTLTGDEVDGLLDWLDGGGHLVVRTPQADADDAESYEGGLLAALSLQPSGADRSCLHITAVPPSATERRRAAATAAAATTPDAKARIKAKARHDREHVDAFCGGARFTLDGVEPRLWWGDLKSGYAYARLAQGDGTVDVLADLDLLANRALESATAAAFARQLLAPNYGQGVVHLVYAASMPPLWRLLLDRAWMAWLPLLVGFVAWLWMRTQRFGPLAPSPAADRRALLEHVQASGEHLWRYGQAALLHGAVRDAFLDRLRRRDPMAAALDGAAQADAIAARTGRSAADVTAALQSPRPNDARDFVQRISRLIQLRRQL